MIINFCNDLSRVTLLIGQLALFGYFIASKTMILEGGVLEISSATYDWQALLEKSRSDIIKAPWIPIFPALAITYTIFTFNLLGEGLRQKFGLGSNSSKQSVMQKIKKLSKKTKLLYGMKRVRWILVFLLILTGGVTIWSNDEDTVPSVTGTSTQKEVPESETTAVKDAYKKEGDLLVPITESTTKKGGLYDSISFIKTAMEQTKSTPFPVFEEEGIKLVCKNSIDKCIQPVFYLKNPLKTPAEAEQVLKDHLPDDMIIKEELKLEGETAFNMLSEKFSKCYPLEDKGGFSIIYKRNEENLIFAVTVTIGHKKY